MDYFKDYKLKSAWAVFFKFVEALFELILPLMMVHLIDQGIQMHNTKVIINTVLWMCLLSLLGYLSSLVCQYYASFVSQKVGGRIRSALFKKMMTFSFVEYDTYASSLLTTRITNDVNQIQEMIAKAIRLGVRAPLLMIGSLVALYQISPELSIRLLWSFPVFILVVIVFMLGSMRLHKKAQARLDVLSGKAQEDLSGVRIIRAFSKTDFEFAVFKKLNALVAKAQRAVGYITTLSTPFTSMMMNFVLIFLLYVGAFQIDAGAMSQGQIIAVINYCTQLVLTLIIFMNLVMIFSRGATSWKRVDELMSVKVKQADEGNLVLEKGPLKIEFDHVSFSFKNQRRKVLDDISFILEPQEMLGILGLTGSGKSTIVRLLLRFYDVSEGRILINDRLIEDYSIASLRNAIGYASQSRQFLSGSLESNILMGRDGAVKAALEDAQGSDILSKGLDLKVEAAATNLSGGQGQRVSIARALLTHPSLLILDDSFSALDFLTDKNLRQSIAKKYKNSSQIYISTRTSSLMAADKIIVLHQGRIQDMGSHDYLLKVNKIYQEVYALQSGKEVSHEVLEKASI